MPKIPVRQRNTIQEVQIDAPKGFSAAKTLHNDLYQGSKGFYLSL